MIATRSTRTRTNDERLEDWRERLFHAAIDGDADALDRLPSAVASFLDSIFEDEVDQGAEDANRAGGRSSDG